MRIIEAKSPLHLKEIAQLAEKIIPDHYGSFLPMEHIHYFINTYQTVAAMEEQLLHGFEYYLMTDAGKKVAYLGIDIKDTTLVLSKIYVLNECRGKGIGNLLMKKVYERSAKFDITEIELYVVKENDKAIHFYLNEGFIIAETLDKKYESGYLVKEYKMTKHLK